MATTLSKVGEAGVRTFVALEVPSPVQSAVDCLAAQLDVHSPILKRVAPELIHLTVRFLGSVPEIRLVAVEQATREAAAHVPPFSLAVAGVGTFPPRARVPRVIWVGLDHNAGLDVLQRLFGSLEEELARRGFDREPRGLSPHLTIARVRDGAAPSDARRLGDTVARLRAEGHHFGSFEVRALTVMRSDPGPAGPRYTPLAHAPLDGANP